MRKTLFSISFFHVVVGATHVTKEIVKQVIIFLVLPTPKTLYWLKSVRKKMILICRKIFTSLSPILTVQRIFVAEAALLNIQT